MKKLFLIVVAITNFLLGSITYNGQEYIEQDMDIVIDSDSKQYVVTAGSVEYVNTWLTKKV